MDLRKLKTLIDLISESNVTEIEITEAEGSVRIVKAPPASAQAPAHVLQYAPAAAPAPASPLSPAPAPASPVAAASAVVGHIVPSPMVGSFYRSSSPGAKPFVEVGDTVAAGQTLCIIEAMKILNEIEADQAGVVQAILPANGDAVEYGQTLMILG